MRHRAIFGVFAIILASTTAATAEIPDIPQALTGKFVNDLLDNFHDKLLSTVGEAGVQAHYATEHAAREAELLVKSARYQFSAELDKRVSQLDGEKQEFLIRLDQMVAKISRGGDDILRLEDFAYIDAQSLMKLPFASEKMVVRRVDGYSQVFRTTGSYPMVILGSAFGPETKCEVNVAGTSVSDVTYPEKYTAKIEIPAAALNPLFDDAKVKRVDISIDVFLRDSGKRIFSYSDKILLLPKYPIEYHLFETTSVPGWSEKTKTASNDLALPPTGKERRQVDYRIKVRIPDGCLLIPGSARRESTPFGPTNHFWWLSDAPVQEDDRTMRQDCRYEVHDKPDTVTLSVDYHEPEKKAKDVELTLKDGETALKGRIGYGIFLAALSPGYQFFEFRGTFFNGEAIKLTPSNSQVSGASATVESASEAKRLVIKVEKSEH